MRWAIPTLRTSPALSGVSPVSVPTRINAICKADLLCGAGSQPWYILKASLVQIQISAGVFVISEDNEDENRSALDGRQPHPTHLA